MIVSAFAFVSDLLKPKTFAGLFGAAPSVAIASLIITVRYQSGGVGALESRSMMIGAAAFFLYALTMSYLLLRFRLPALKVAFPLQLLWLAAAIGLWYAILD